MPRWHRVFQGGTEPAQVEQGVLRRQRVCQGGTRCAEAAQLGSAEVAQGTVSPEVVVLLRAS